MKQIEFYGDMIDVVELENGQPGVAMRRLVENLGLDWTGQSKKLDDPIYMCRHMSTHDTSGRNQEMLVMPVKSIPAYLFSINPNKVREDLREKLARYRLECVDVLYNYWAKGYAINPRSTTQGILEDYVSGIGAVHTNFLNNLMDNQAASPEHLNAMELVVSHILMEALEAEELDLNHNLVKRKTGWSYMNPTELTVLQAAESEIGLFFAKHGTPETADKVVEMAKQVGKKTTSRLRRAMFISENFSDQFEERIADLLGMK